MSNFFHCYYYSFHINIIQLIFTFVDTSLKDEFAKASKHEYAISIFGSELINSMATDAKES